MRTTTQQHTKTTILLWTVQGLLAALFLFAGSMKFIMPVEVMTKGTSLTGGFIHFIGVCEVLGALGLVLPGLTKVHRELTPFAAVGLLSIMIGAVTLTVAGPQPVQAILPAVVLVLCAVVALARRGDVKSPIGLAWRSSGELIGSRDGYRHI